MNQKGFCRKSILVLLLILAISVMAGCSSSSSSGGSNGGSGGNGGNGNSDNSGGGSSPGLVFFDDFDYQSNTDRELTKFNWYIRTEDGEPGYPGAKWLKNNITFTAVSDTNKALQLSAAVSGSSVSHAEINNTQTFFEGTYAARVKFSDTPVEGTDGNYICETFFTISEYNSSAYSECDFEYLPNGGWNGNDTDKRAALFYTTWETNDHKDSKCDRTNGSFSGWHTLTMTVMDGTVTYYVDGKIQFAHSGKYYPDSPMVIDFNLWFLKENKTLLNSKYQQQVDWVYYCKNRALTTAEVEQSVANLRSQGLKRLNQIK